MVERLTREQMAKKYPDTWLGINNIKYENDDKVTVEEADVVYTDKSAGELLEMQIDGIDGIIAWYTNDNTLPLGACTTPLYKESNNDRKINMETNSRAISR